MNKYYFTLLSLILPGAGAYLKMRDSNNTGADDVIGNICIAAAPAIDGLQMGDDSKVKKALTAIRDAINVYLAQTAQ